VKALLALLLPVLVVPFFLRAADPSLLEAIRRGDTSAVKMLLASRTNPNTTDASGATALMHAAAFASEAEMRLLIDAGANINAANAYGATALMWAAGDTAKVRVLLDRGANANARALDRTNALIVAARHNNTNAMRLLMASGADPKAASSDIVNLLRIAYSTDDPSVRQFLAENGIELKDPAQLGTPLIALNLIDTELVQKLLDVGADPKQEVPIVTINVPTLSVAANQGAFETVKLLVAHGADARVAGSRGWTPLMMAAAATHPDPAVVAFLIEKGADLKARDDVGRTALDWALTQGDTAVARQLKKAGAVSTAASPSAPPPIAKPRTAAASVEKAIAQLQPIGPVFYEKNKCISCHNQSLPSMAVKLASARSIPVDRTLAPHPSEATLATWRVTREQFLLGNSNFPGFAATVSYGLAAMAEEGLAPNEVTDAAAFCLAVSQARDGSFGVPIGGIRPPLGGSDDIHFTALAIRALTVYAPPGRQADTKARIARAREFLQTAKPRDTQSEAFKLAGLVWSGAPSADLSTQAKRVVALQRQDGGWAQLPTMASDAYATGQALYSLHLQGVSPTSAAYRKGVEYLLRTQLEDGTWFVRSRGFAFQPYFDTGFPHGRNQFISAAATSWAAIALAYTL